MKLQDRTDSNEQGARCRTTRSKGRASSSEVGSVSFEQCATAHFADTWQVVPQQHRPSTGRFYELPSRFSVLEFQRKRTWCYATVGMSAGEPDGIETFIVTPGQNLRAVEFLYYLTHFHLTGARLDLGHTVNFGEELWDGSGLDHGFLSFPYVEEPGFESFDCENGRTNVAWLIPITSAERDYKKEHGVEALEALFEEYSLNYLNPSRASLV
ncbi:suppressor of fused domain protein [Dactylosporangium sp. NPDC048998]|uniref:suppressor of fused domain protein n=1 Tax=Dactylosporangium sp. NPDC048998 TaxID=3363976 RepID=UPI0037183827